MTHAMTLRLPEDLHEALRVEAHTYRTSITALIVDTLRVREIDRARRTGCDVCNRPHIMVSTPGGFRFCADHKPTEQACTCPSGDGSLRWPCPVHPPTESSLPGPGA